MAQQSQQTFENHTRFDPKFHFFLSPLAAILFVTAAFHAFRHPEFVSLFLAFGAFLFLVSVFLIRIYVLKVQDRVIRLEERLRLATLLSDSQRPRITDLTERQLIALRFASDAELPALAMRTLQEQLAPKDIKKSIRNWRADDFRI